MDMSAWREERIRVRQEKDGAPFRLRASLM
jgi:hypothetical protein